MFKITIPQPCQEDWDKMLPNPRGRHCNACAKTVVDFSIMSDVEVQQFFINKNDENVCGRFKNEQLHRITIDIPENVFYMPLPFWKKFLVACLIVFSTTLFSCDTTIDGKPITALKIMAYDNAGKLSVPDPLRNLYVGRLSFTWDSTITIPQTCGTTYGYSVMIWDTSKSNINTILVKDSVMQKTADTVFKKLTDSISFPKKDTIKIKNPPKADSTNCNEIKYY